MKNYEEMANDVLHRISEYENTQKHKRQLVARTITSLSCVCLVALIGFGMWKGGLLTFTPVQIEGDASHSGNNETIDVSKGESPDTTATSKTEAQIDNTDPSGDNNPHAGYLVIPIEEMSYEKAKQLFGHSIIKCTAEDFLGYQICFISPNGDVNHSDTRYLSVIYTFENGTIQLIDQKRVGKDILDDDLYTQQEYKGCTFWSDGTTGTIFYPLQNDLILTAQFTDKEPTEIYELMKSLEF